MLLMDTLPMLGNVLMLCSFVFFIFGILAVQLWSSVLRQRCTLTTDMGGWLQTTKLVEAGFIVLVLFKYMQSPHNRRVSVEVLIVLLVLIVSL